MSRVLRVLDERNGRRYALKQALTSERSRQDSRALVAFRQEYHVLSQLVHPSVVQVGEYGLEDGRPFYVMELVEGTTLNELAPSPWPRLCRVLVDLCSPLSMLHALRYVHGDVTPRNVIITKDGETKLIDFGTLTRIDQPIHSIAGTPPHMAPEIVRGQAIDGRVDLFAMGALAYWMLSRRHAYPARTIQELPEVWQTTPASLIEMGIDVPRALDRLILSLLSLDPDARPLQLAEVVHRLSVILGDTYVSDASLRAQIAVPKLVGREKELALVREAHARAAAAKVGTLLCIRGASGMGRSRVLQACALEAALAGSFVIRLGCRDGSNLPFGLLSRIVLSALHQDPRLNQSLHGSLRDAREGEGDAEAKLASALGKASASELQRLWRDLSSHQTAVILVDDLDRADLPSIQQLLTFVAESKLVPTLLVVTVESEDSQLLRGLTALGDLAQNFELKALSAGDTQQLLRSIFGDVLGLERLAEWTYHATAGVPRACVDLAHYALERSVVTYAAGHFSISQDVENAALPPALDDRVATRVAALGPPARQVLGLLSLVTRFGLLSAFELPSIFEAEGWLRADVLDALDELLDARLIEVSAAGYELCSESIRRRAALQLTAAQTRTWHGRLAAFYEQKGHSHSMLTAFHYDLAGERAVAYAKLIQVDAQLHGPDDPNIMFGGSPLGVALHRTMLDHAIASHAPRTEVIHFKRVLLRIGAVSDPSLGAVAYGVLAQLREDIGLDLWDQADPALDEHQRLMFCLTRAEERSAGAPPGERLSVFDAVSHFAQSVSAMSAIGVSTFNPSLLEELVELIRPLRTLAPALAFTASLLDCTARLLSQGGRDVDRWRPLLHALEEIREAMPPMIYAYVAATLHFRVGRDLAMIGDDAYATHANHLTSHRRTLVQ